MWFLGALSEIAAIKEVGIGRMGFVMVIPILGFRPFPRRKSTYGEHTPGIRPYFKVRVNQVYS